MGLVADMPNKCSGEFTTTPNVLPEANCHEKKMKYVMLKKLLNNKSNCCHKQASQEVINWMYV